MELDLYLETPESTVCVIAVYFVSSPLSVCVCVFVKWKKSRRAAVPLLVHVLLLVVRRFSRSIMKSAVISHDQELPSRLINYVIVMSFSLQRT